MLLYIIHFTLFVVVMANKLLLKSFLRNALSVINPSSSSLSSSTRCITLCIGNEASDADSIISSLCMAYLKSQSKTTTTISINSIYVPVVSVNRQELVLRRETELLLKEVDLELSDLICLDEFNADGLKMIRDVILLDHNNLSNKVVKQIPTTATVIEIYDHHQDAQLYPDISFPKRNIAFDNVKKIATVGSTCTLVFEQFFSSPSSKLLLDDTISTLLLGVIALDTSNGDLIVGKASERDINAMTTLQILAEKNQDALYIKLRDAKMDIVFWKALTVEECLLLDFKKQPIPTFCHGPELGVSSVLLPLEDFFSKPFFVQQISQYMKEQELDMLGVMTFILTPKYTRQLMIVTRNSQRLQQFQTYCAAAQCPDNIVATLQLTNLEPEIPLSIIQAMQDCGLSIFAYQQGNVKASRKQVLPILMQFYDSIIDTLNNDEEEIRK